MQIIRFRGKGYVFAPPMWAVGVTLLLLGVTVWMGRWQWHKAEIKAARMQQYVRALHAPAQRVSPHDTQVPNYTRLIATGTWDVKRAVFLDNKPYQGRPGYYLIMPLVLASGERLLVNRGWVSQAAQAQVPLAALGGATTVTGFSEVMVSHKTLSADNIAGVIWQNLTPALYTAHFNVPVLPYTLKQQGVASPADAVPFIRDWPVPDEGRMTNVGYTFQWAAIGLMVCVIFMIRNLKQQEGLSDAHVE